MKDVKNCIYVGGDELYVWESGWLIGESKIIEASPELNHLMERLGLIDSIPYVFKDELGANF
jgi:hypothetical protein